MEEYRKIWDEVQSNPDEDFVFSDEIWKKYYTTSKILNNSFRSVVEFCCDEGDTSNEKRLADKRTENLRQLYTLYKTKIKWKNPTECRYLNVLHPVANCPQKSLLDAIQQEIYCYLYEKLAQTNPRSPLTKEENSLFNTLHQKVLQERPMFYKYVENMWAAHQRRCQTIQPEIKKYVDTVWKLRMSSVNTYPQKYCNVKMVPLVFSGNSKLVRALPAAKDSSSSGIASRYIPPNYGAQLKVSTDYDEIAAIFPPDSFATKVPVSRDQTAQGIVSSCRPDVVISMSGLKCIMDNFNPEYDREWDIPVVVREEKSSKVSTYSKKVVYIDKPLPPRSMSIMEKNKWYHKYGIRALLCRPRSQGILKPTVPVPVNRPNVSPTKSVQNTTTEQAVATRNEVKGKSSEPISEKGNAKSGDDETPVESSEEESWCPSDSSTEKLVIACSDDDSVRNRPTPMKRKVTFSAVPNRNRSMTPEKRRKSYNSDEAESELHDKQNSIANVHKEIRTYGKQSKHEEKIEKGGSDVSATTSLAAHEPVKSSPSNNGVVSEEQNCSPVDRCGRTNLMSNYGVSYKLWKLMLEKDSQEETRANFLKSESSYKPIVMLIRNKQDAVRIINGEVHPVCLTSKLEYQSEYGMELSAMSDVCRQWVSLYFRDKCTMVRARTDAPTHKLLLVEDKKMEDVTREWFDQRIRSSLLSILYSVLLGVLDVEPGNYLLSHRKKMGAFVSLMKATDRDGSFDLKQTYESVDTEPPIIVKEIQWPPLDANLQTPNQYKLHRVPGLFQPCAIAQNTTNKIKKFPFNKKKWRNNKKKKPTQGNNKKLSQEQTSPVKFCR